MRLPRFFRHFVAELSVYGNRDVSGKLFDYNNGRWDQLLVWSGSKTEAISIVENMLSVGRDAIYVAGINHQQNCGLFRVIDSQRKVYNRFWSLPIYTPIEAYKDLLVYLHKRSKEMGWPAREN